MRPWAAGSAIALTGVAASAFLISDPPVYGICVACHTRDLLTAAAPLLTVPGILIGAFLGARFHGEFRPQRPDRLLSSFLLGATAMVASLVALGCTLRLLLRAANGDTLAWLAIGGVAAGIAVGTGFLSLHARGRAP